MTNLVYIGYITGPFGLKGEVKIISDSNHLDKIFKINNKLIIDNQDYVIKTYRKHQNNHLVSFEGFNDINKIDNLLRKEVYINKEELNIAKDEFLYAEIIGFDIIDNGQKIGKVEEVLLNKNNTLIKTGNLIIPLIDKYFEKVDTESKIVYVKASRELNL